MRIPKSASTSTKPQQIRAVGYVRVSTEIQVSEGVSLETQRVKIRAHCIAHDIDPVSYTHLRAHETVLHLVCRLLL